MIEKIYFDMLTQDIAWLRKQQFVTIEGVEYSIGATWRRAYKNSPQGRAEVAAAEMPDQYKAAIFTLWGDTPTVSDTDI